MSQTVTAAQGDYRVAIRVSNARLWHRIRAMGFDSLAAFCRARKIGYTAPAKYLALAMAPILPNGEARQSATDLADALACGIEDIFPPAMLTRTLENRVIVQDVTEDQVKSLVSRARQPDDLVAITDARRSVHAAIKALKPRDAQVLTLRYGLDGGGERTLDECGKILKVHQERIRQMQYRAERMLRHPGRKLGAHMAALQDVDALGGEP
tara:strand:+ start:188 stop:817 length:630 start_codon:yes stop_codon:yes gene_type:complete